jgi:hypothetical protein
MGMVGRIMIMIVDRQSRAESPRRAFSAPSSELRVSARAPSIRASLTRRGTPASSMLCALKTSN